MIKNNHIIYYIMKSFIPLQRILMGPGPSDVPPRILQALSKSTIGHLDPLFIQMMDEIQEMLKKAFCTENNVSLPISAPGSAGMEFCLVNLLEKGDKAIVCKNGVFGERLAENVLNCGAEPLLVEQEWGKPVDLNKLEQTLKTNEDAVLLCFVHAETSTGVRSDAAEIAKLAQKYGVLCVADCVTSLGGIELKIDEWGIDAAYSGTQKCLSVPPGLSPITMGKKALAKVQKRTQRIQSWFLNLNLLAGYWINKNEQNKRSYHHTAPVNSLYGLHEGLVMLHELGLEQSHQKHQQMHQKLLQGLQALGIEMLVEKDYRLPQLNAVKIPTGVDEAKVRQTLLEVYNIEIGAGLGSLAGKIWRIGLMGHSAREENIDTLLSALKDIL